MKQEKNVVIESSAMQFANELVKKNIKSSKLKERISWN